MPNWFAFEQQSDEYKESVIPASITKRVAIEMASPLGWHKYVVLKVKLSVLMALAQVLQEI